MKIKFILKTSVMFLFLIILLTDCATIVSKSNYPINIRSTPTGANFSIIDKHGLQIFNGVTPAVVSLKAGAGYFSKAEYLIQFTMNGYDTQKYPITFHFNGWYIGNIVFGGLIGLLIVDPLTGAMWKIDNMYINTTLSKTTASTDNNPSLKVLSINDIPKEWKEHLVKIK